MPFAALRLYKGNMHANACLSSEKSFERKKARTLGLDGRHFTEESSGLGARQ